jgi:hypothetical protein
MNTVELNIWDYLSLAAALLVIALYVLSKIRRNLSGKGHQCHGCTRAKCSTTVDFASRNHGDPCK